MSHEAEETGARPVYESMAEEYAAELDRNPWNSLYERPGTVALLPPVAGKQVLDVGCGPGSLVNFWRRPLTDMFSAIEEAGFRVERLSEPQPLEQCRDRYPEAWARLTTEPHFVFFRLTSRSSTPT